MVEFYDCHAHCIKEQCGGILIGLEGAPFFEGTLSNENVFTLVNENPNYLGCYYITKEWNTPPNELCIKYHPRREKYTSDEVIADLSHRNCKLCVIDTLNQPYWSYLDYWKVIASYPSVTFILPHVGGYDILDFIKILDFNKNVYVDFSMTQEYFGWCGTRSKLPIVADCIDYVLGSNKLNNRVLFGSDEPFFSQNIALEKYLHYNSARKILTDNFENILNCL